MIRGREYPLWICAECGARYGRSECRIATWHEDTCGICGEVTSCTEARDYGHLRDGWRDEASAG